MVQWTAGESLYEGDEVSGDEGLTLWKDPISPDFVVARSVAKGETISADELFVILYPEAESPSP